jgi:hypothetical protein
MTAKLLEALGVSQQVQEQKLTTLKEYLVEQDSSIKQSVERVELDVQLGNQQRDEKMTQIIARLESSAHK